MKYLNLHTHKSTNSAEILEVVNQYPHEYNPNIPHYSVGIHPWYINESRIEDDLNIIESALQYNECLAVGECGLDKRIDIPFDLQINVFEKQLLIAEDKGKPVIIHCVGAFQELIDIRKDLDISVPVVVHGFSKSNELAQQLIKNGIYLSFGKYLLRNPELESVFRIVPDDCFFLETDTTEESIEQVYRLAAIYKNMTLEALQEKIQRNYSIFFNHKTQENKL